MCPVKRTHVAAAAALVVLAVPTLTACFNGPAATTTVQATKVSGNGAKAALGGLRHPLKMPPDRPGAFSTGPPRRGMEAIAGK